MVIASDVGDVSYIIDDKVNGFVVPAKNLDELARAMVHCASLDGAELKLIGEQAHQKAIERFSQEVHVEKMQSIFRSALAR